MFKCPKRRWSSSARACALTSWSGRSTRLNSLNSCRFDSGGDLMQGLPMIEAAMDPGERDQDSWLFPCPLLPENLEAGGRELLPNFTPPTPTAISASGSGFAQICRKASQRKSKREQFNQGQSLIAVSGSIAPPSPDVARTHPAMLRTLLHAPCDKPCG